MAQSLKNPTQQNFLQKTLGAQLLAGTTSAATLNNTTSIQNLPGVMIVDRIDTNNNETPTKREVVIYQATSGSTVTTLTRNADGSGTTQDHAVGAIVEFGPDILWAQSVIDGLTQVIVPSTGLLDTTKVADLTTTQALTNKDLSSATNTLPTTTVTLTGVQALTNKTITDSTNNVMANSLKSATTTVDVSAATAPTSGQVLTATGGSAATWQSATTGPAFNDNGSTISGQMLIQTGSPTAFAGNDTTSFSKTITFTTAFKAATTPRASVIMDTSIGSNSANMFCSISAISNTAMTVKITSTSGNIASGSTYSFHWIAIGQA